MAVLSLNDQDGRGALSLEEQEKLIEAHRARKREEQRRYKKTPAGKAVAAAYRASPAGKAAKAAYRASPAGKIAIREARQRYKKSPAGKAAKARERAKYRVISRAARKSARQFSRKLKKKERAAAPFVGCDGEGITVTRPDGSRGEHRYVLFRMGERELYRDDARLTTGEILSFILDHPRKTDILVGFAFEYDITSILVDLPADRRVHLMETYQQLTPVADGSKPPPRPPGYAKRWTWVTFPDHGTFGLNWLSRNHLSVCRPHPRGSVDPRHANSSDRNSIRTIYDTFGFFQTSFVKALKSWEVGGDKLEAIAAMKKDRGAFETMTADIRAYNADECHLLGEAMTKFRMVCRECSIEPRTWNGAGKIASFLHNTHDTLKRRDIEKLVKIGVIRMAHAAYYGGRFEITRAGLICEEVHERDLNSAYPAMMRRLPCLIHGKWHKVSGDVLRDAPEDAIFVCPIRFDHPPDQFLCGLPFRSHRDGRLSWPREARGVYWGCEIRSAERLGASCAYGSGWLYEWQCDCKPFAWVDELYRERKALGDLKGKPIKLGINALYGKLAQRIGEPQFANPIWAGLITAMTRAALNDAIRSIKQDRVVMIATDAIYTIGKPPRVRTGEGLGEWGSKTWPQMFIVQPGLYWGSFRKDGQDALSSGTKSRGISATTIEEYTAEFERKWLDFAASGIDPFRKRVTQFKLLLRCATGEKIDDEEAHAARLDFPFVKVKFPAFIGLRLAGHWGKPELAGQWIDQERDLSFDWTGKRDRHEWTKDRNGRPLAAILHPLAGSPHWVSAHYEENGGLATSESWEVERMLFETMPWAEPLAPFAED